MNILTKDGNVVVAGGGAISTKGVPYAPTGSCKNLFGAKIWEEDDSIDNWHDTNDEPPIPPEPEDEATIEDTYNALNTLGVKED